MASSVTQAELKDALIRYPAVIRKISKESKKGALSLEELDKFRYQTAPINFGKSNGRPMEIADVKKLIDWKMRHGTFRPALTKLVNSNSDEKVAAVTKDAFDYYADNEDDIAGVLERISSPLRGIGPAAASLILAVHDSERIVFFSDELYKWLCADGSKVSLKYTIKEFKELFGRAKALMSRINCTPIELEKAAFVFIKEHEPEIEKKPKYQPTGLPRGRPPSASKTPGRLRRGRPPKPESEKKPKYQPTGLPRGRPASASKTPDKLPRGRPPKPESEKPKYQPSGLPRGRPPSASKTPYKLPRGRPPKPESEKKPKYQPTGLPRGRPPSASKTLKVTAKPATKTEVNLVPKKRGRPAKIVPTMYKDGDDFNDGEREEEQEQTSVPVHKKRKGTPGTVKKAND